MPVTPYSLDWFKLELKKWTNTFPNKTAEEVKKDFEDRLSGVENLNNLLSEENKKLKKKVEELEKHLEQKQIAVIETPAKK
jgi:hypothetical protein